MKTHQTPEGNCDEWLTPPEMLRALGEFHLDPCAPNRPPWVLASYIYRLPLEDGLVLSWHGRVWCNPPFNRYQRPKWMKKMAEHGNGIMLIPAATETQAFFDCVWNKADAVCFVKGRPHFYYPDGTRSKANCGCSIALVAYGMDNVVKLVESNLGKTIILSK